MNEWLAQMYGTNTDPQVVEEEQAKLAQVELFAKLASDSGVDLDEYTDEQIQELFNEVMLKEAQENEPGEGAAHEKSESKAKEEGEDEGEAATKEKAKEEFAEKKAFSEKFAEADFMGRVMAHAFTQEKDAIEKTAKEDKKPLSERVGEAAGRNLEKGTAAVGGGYGGAVGGVGGAVAARKAGEKIVGKHWVRSQQGGKLGRLGKAIGGKKGQIAGAALGAAGGAAAGGLAGRGYGRFAKGMTRGAAEEKKASATPNLDLIAAEHAVKIAEAAEYDTDEAIERLNAVLTLGVEDSEKLAYAPDEETAVHIRGLELLESAGYPVNWEEVFGE